MKPTLSSRRSFITRAAVLTAGIAALSPTQLFAAPPPARNLKKTWNAFYKMQNGKILHAVADLKDSATERVTAGHSIVVGDCIVFENEEILARPIWVYWGSNTALPNDVIISFFSAGEAPKKLFRINSYELQALFRLNTENEQPNAITLLKSHFKNGIKSKPAFTTKVDRYKVACTTHVQTI